MNILSFFKHAFRGITAAFIFTTVLCPPLHAYWVWTPKTGTWINPKYAVKDTPEKQLEWAMGLYDEGEFKKAISEFAKLIEHFPNSTQAPLAQYYIGRSNEENGSLYEAYRAYQKTIERYPYNERVEEIIERQYMIGTHFLEGEKAKIMGMKILPALDKAAEIFTQVVENSPFGRYADIAQYKAAEAYKKLEYYEEAVIAYQKLIDEYPQSPLVEDAKYQIAQCTYFVSRDPYYDQEFTDRAIESYEKILQKSDDSELSEEAQNTLARLREKKAMSSFDTAQFYERMKRYNSALIYYREILETYPDTQVALEARKKIDELEREID